MTSLNRLTALERVRDWAGITTTNDDVLLTRLIDEMSRFILSYIQRPTLFQNSFSDTYDGAGHQVQTLRHWPVLSVSSVTVNDINIVAASGTTGSGFVTEPWDGFPPGRPQSVALRGYEYCRGYSNVKIVYTAGFIITHEAHTVPASGNYTVAVDAPHGSWGSDQGVTYATGVPLTLVTSSPAVGQYTLTGCMYGFAAADANAGVLISYSYIPADIEHACMEMVGERYRYKNRIGEISKSLGGQETIAFSQKAMPDYIRTLLQPYRRVVLV